MDDLSAWSRDVALCPPAVLMALDAHTPESSLPHALESVWQQALHDAQILPHPRGEPDASMRTRAAAAVKPSTQKLDTAEFFTIAAELERVTKDIESSRPVELCERVKKLAVDALDEHMFDTLVPSQRAQGRQVVQLFTAHQYEAALSSMLQLVSACPAEKRTAALFNNEAVCYFRLERWHHSKQACERALALYHDFEVCRRRLTRLHLAMGNLTAATAEAQPFKAAPQWAAEWRAIKAYEAYTLLSNSHQYLHAQRELQSLLTAFPCATFESLKVQLLSLESTPEAVAYARLAHERYPFSVDLQFWSAELSFHSASTSAALHAVLKMFHSASVPKTDTRFRLSELRVRASLTVLTHVEALEAEARWEELVAACTASLEQRHTLHDGMKLALYSARAAAFTATRNWYGGLDDALRATSYAESPSKKAALLLLASQCEEGLQRYKDALHHAEQSQRLAPNARTAARIRALQVLRAQHTQKRQAREREARETRDAPRFDDEPHAGAQQHDSQYSRSSSLPPPPSISLKPHLQVLGVSESATALEVRRAYRALAMQWHPDKWSSAPASDVATAEQRFKEVQNAYETVMNMLAL